MKIELQTDEIGGAFEDNFLFFAKPQQRAVAFIFARGLARPPETLSTLCKNQIPVNAHPDLEWFDVRIHAGRPAVRRVQYWPLTPVKRRSPGSISRSGMLPWTDCG